MYQIGDRFMYSSHGVCEIIDIELKRIDRKNIEYYVLSPINNSKACFYIPTQNQKALSKLSPLLTVSEIEQLLLELSEGDDVWLQDENVRKQRLKEVLASCNQTEMIQWIRSLHVHRRILLDSGRKFHQADESFLKDAEKIMTTEFSVVLGIPESAVMQYVCNLVKK